MVLFLVSWVWMVRAAVMRDSMVVKVCLVQGCLVNSRVRPVMREGG